MTLSTENPKNSTQKFLELINEFSKLLEYKINIQILVAFLFTNNKISTEDSLFFFFYLFLNCAKKKKKILMDKPEQAGERLIHSKL